ncbi:hypothetical protein QBZ16_004678 [Prototheca wickerhamii]|uniref:Uncharacterized protein n=1 Tax=Prototheca wickerhamii TaxID=3111 RepID=A0AAD9IIK9_PROWI|nr:hypothetical protein QBZ16_004678 [Prototheca wickerhamii]
MKAIADWFIYGEVDWDAYTAKLQEWGPLVAGLLFGAGWWCWADAYVYQHAVQGSAYPFKYNWPGIVATIALVLINALPRRDLKELSESGEEGEAVRGHLWLLVSLLLAFGAVAGSVSVLVHCSQTDLVSVGVGSVLQCGFILASAMLLWAFRTDTSGLGYYTSF